MNSWSMTGKAKKSYQRCGCTNFQRIKVMRAVMTVSKDTFSGDILKKEITYIS